MSYDQPLVNHIKLNFTPLKLYFSSSSQLLLLSNRATPTYFSHKIQIVIAFPRLLIKQTRIPRITHWYSAHIDD